MSINYDNAGEITICKWYYGADRQAWYAVGWETNEGAEHERRYRKLETALDLIRRLMEWREIES